MDENRTANAELKNMFTDIVKRVKQLKKEGCRFGNITNENNNFPKLVVRFDVYSFSIKLIDTILYIDKMEYNIFDKKKEQISFYKITYTFNINEDNGVFWLNKSTNKKYTSLQIVEEYINWIMCMAQEVNTKRFINEPILIK